MDEGPAWRTFPGTHPDIPALLVATTFGPSSYAVHLTDLTHMWAESLERRAICMRAFTENTTIDPSYDNEQMSVFLGKLRAALDASSAEYNSTRVTLAASPYTGQGTGDSLILHVTATLPQGLEPLRWPLYLDRQPSSAVTSDLVVPLIHDRAARQRAGEHLMAALHDKDAVINKLVDKLEAMGSGVQSAFPTLIGRRKISRQDLEQHVRGLAPFDEAAFRNQFSSRLDRSIDNGEEGSTINRLVDDAFGKKELRWDAAPASAKSHRSKPWWRELGTGLGVPLANKTVERSNQQPGSRAVTPIALEDDNHSDDSFQATPSRPSSTKLGAKVSTAERTEQTSPAPRHESTSITKPKTGLGKIGGRGNKARPAAVAVTKKEQKQSVDETAPEADERDTRESIVLPKREDATTISGGEEEAVPASAASIPQRTRPLMRGLGRIGGKKSPEPQPSYADAADPPLSTRPKLLHLDNEVLAPKSPTRSSLGHFGKKATVASKYTASERATSNDVDDTSKWKATPEDMSETAKEAYAVLETDPKISDSKRAEMLQQAVAKHAAPVRKKRKF